MKFEIPKPMAWMVKPARMMEQNWWEYSRLVSVAPRKSSVGVRNSSATIVSARGTTMSMSSVTDMARLASSTLRSPRRRAAMALPPTPNHAAKAPVSIMSGKATVVAAMPASPTP